MHKKMFVALILVCLLVPLASACPEPEPEPRPQYHYKTTWKNPQYRKVWNGIQWIDNPNTHSYWEDGRFWVVFPKY